jgi:hypothetical protein
MKDKKLVKKVNFLYKERVDPPAKLVAKIQEKIIRYFKPELISIQLGTELLNSNQKAGYHARMIAQAVHLEQKRAKARHSKTKLTSMDQAIYSKTITLNLKNEIDGLLTTIRHNHYSPAVYMLLRESEVVTRDQVVHRDQLSFVNRLEELSHQLSEILEATHVEMPPGKRGKTTDAFRLNFISALTDTWMDMAKLPPKQLTIKHDKNKLSALDQYKEDSFTVFLKEFVGLFGRPLNLEEVARTSVQCYRKRLKDYKKLSLLYMEKASQAGLDGSTQLFLREQANKFAVMAKGYK